MSWIVGIVLIAPLCAQWLSKVTATVPEPYLDEFFHVRQAQVFCDGHFEVWDPKITTPPGLYLLSTIVNKVTGRCDITTLRAVNCVAICTISLVVFSIFRKLSQSQTYSVKTTTSSVDVVDGLVAAIIALFPPLFFFSALYYTDVVSTLLVLVHYNIFLRSRTHQSFSASIQLIIVGLLALLYRQTNIFWVAVFPAGLSIIQRFETQLEISTSYSEILQKSWSQSKLYTLPVEDASVEDYIVFLLSTAIVVIRNPFTVLQLTAPYLALLGAFGAFVAWNGGVVLGDKSNHVATLHFPQMLYFWPYTIFFALPLTVHPILALVERVLLPKQAYIRGTWKPISLRLPRVLPALLFTLIGLLAVHFNTIIHPFTLADNRHYVFYVFRILRKHPAIKYIAVPIYIACGWLALQLLGTSSNDPAPPTKNNAQQGVKKQATAQQTQSFNSVGFVVVWVITTALSTITAPLVEPRYFILPWIIWRIHVHRPSTLGPASVAVGSSRGRLDRKPSDAFPAAQKLWLCLEALWYLLINVVTGYMFLHRGFAWPQEPGRIQRFMW